MRFKYLATASAAALSVAFAAPALAQQVEPGVTDRAQDTALTDPTSATQDQGARTVEEIVVTAQKREQSLQDVPIVVTAISEQALEDAGVRDIKDLTQLTPGLVVTSTSNESVTTARIRGVGTVGDNPGLESSVGVVIDGVYRPRNGVGFSDLGELERIEVLKGPQGTLFGKNTSAGVINVITKRPSFNFGAEGEFEVGNYGTLGAAASVTGPIAEDVLAGRLYVARRVRDGLYDVRTGDGPRTETEDNDRDYYTVRGQLLAVGGDNFEANLIVDYTKREEFCCAGVQTLNNPGLQGVINALAAGGQGVDLTPDPFERLAFSNRNTEQEIEDKGASLEVTYDITPDITLTSISAVREWESKNGQDSDFTGADIWYRTPDIFSRKFTQASQEVRLAGSTERLDWLVGAFYAREELDANEGLRFGTDYEPYFSLILSGLPSPALARPTFIQSITGQPVGTNFPLGQGSNDRFRQNTDSVALFTNNSFRVTDALELTLGLRYTKEEKELVSVYSNLGSTACSAVQGAAGAGWIAAAYAALGVPAASITPTLIGTARQLLCVTGLTDPAFNNARTSQDKSEEEVTGTLKAAYRFTDDILTYVSYARGYKAGGFNLDRERTGSPALGTTVLDPNTAFEAEFVDSYEIGAKTEFLDNSLLLNATIFHQTFDNFQLNTFTGTSFIVTSIPEVVSRGVDADFLWLTPVEGLTFQGGVTYAETQYGEFVPGAGVSTRLPNARLSFAPLWSTTASATYERPVGAGLLFRANLGVKYTSSYNTGSDLAPSKVQEGFALVNGRLGIGAEDGRWTVEAWSQNLTDEEYYQVAFDAPLQTLTGPAVNAFLGQPRMYGLTFRAQY
jgi:iron complex outermembrane recepter protein